MQGSICGEIQARSPLGNPAVYVVKLQDMLDALFVIDKSMSLFFFGLRHCVQRKKALVTYRGLVLEEGIDARPNDANSCNCRATVSSSLARPNAYAEACAV